MTAQAANYYNRNSDRYYQNIETVSHAGNKGSSRRARRAIKLFVLAIFFAAVLFAGILIGNSTGSKNVQASNVYTETTKYTSVKVMAGDTLWAIAEEYMPSGYDTTSYIEEVKRINNLTEDTIHAGAYLVIPYMPSENEL